MSAFDDLPKVTRQVEQIQREADRAEGAAEQLMKRIKSEFGCKTQEHAESLLMDLQTKEVESYKRYNRKKSIFMKTWKKVLRKLRKGSEDGD